jgi:hypothetical protein
MPIRQEGRRLNSICHHSKTTAIQREDENEVGELAGVIFDLARRTSLSILSNRKISDSGGMNSMNF